MRLLLAILLVTSVHFGAHLFLPAMPKLASVYGLSEIETVQIMMLYFIGFGVSFLFYGPWLESVGERMVFFCGMSLFTIGCVLCYFIDSPDMLAVGRLLQGLGAGSPMVLSRALIKDAQNAQQLNKAINGLSIASATALVIAPVLGGWSSAMFGWQMSFLLLGLYLLMVMACGSMFLPIAIKHKSHMPFRSIASDYLRLLCDRDFLCIGVFKWVPTLLFFTAITYLPFVMQQRFGLSQEQYGLMMMLPFCGKMFGGILSGVLQRYLSPRATLAVFWPLLLGCSAILLFAPVSAVNVMGAFGLFMIVSGAYYPTCLKLIISRFKFKSETANSMLGAVDMLVVSVLSILVNQYLLTDLQDLGGLFTLGTMVLLINWLILHHAITWHSAEKRLMQMIKTES